MKRARKHTPGRLYVRPGTKLNSREIACAAFLELGMRPREIAEAMDLSASYARYLVWSTRKKLGVHAESEDR